jgi:EmrB/QacA subfamily drug resistance transporter
MISPLRRSLGLLVVGSGSLITPLDSSVNIAFPYIVGDFGEPMAMIQWVVICYVLTYASLMLVFGKLGDLFGHRRIFGIGLAVSSIGLLLVSVSPNFESLLFFRFLQGLGSGLVTSVGPALIIALYPEGQRGRAVGMFTLIYALGSMLGPSLGGWLVEQFDWRAVFWFRAPIALFSLALLVTLPTPPKRAGKPSYDIAGSIALILAMSSFMMALNQLQRLDQQGVLPVLGFAIVFALSVAAFIRAEAKAKEPILKLTIFRDIDFTVINLTSCLVYLATFAVMLVIPFLLPRLPGLSVSTAGLVLAVGFVGASIAAPLGGRLIGPLRANWVCFAGAAMTGIGILAIGQVGGADDLPWMIGALFLQGIGTGLFQVSYMYIVTGTLPAADRGVSGSLAMLTRTIGVVTSVTTLTLAFAWLQNSATASGLDEAESFQRAFQDTFTLAGGGLLVFLLATMIRPRIWLGRKQDSTR